MLQRRWELYLLVKLSMDIDLSTDDITGARVAHLSGDTGELVKAVAGGNPDHVEWVKEEAQLVAWKVYGVITPYSAKYAEGIRHD